VKVLVLACLVAAAVMAAAWRPLFDAPDQESFEGRTPQETHLVAADSSGNGNDGINQGGPIIGLPGHAGTAYSFDPQGSWIQVSSNPDLNPDQRDFLLSAWVQLTVAPAPGETYDIVRKGLSRTTNGEFKLEIVPGGRVRCTAKDEARSTAAILGPEISLADGKWHRVGCAMTGSTWSVTVDDTILSEPANLGSITNTMPLSIGSKYGLEDGLRGSRIDEVALYIAAPAPDRNPARKVKPRRAIQQLRSTTPVGLWHLDETG
jgi:hypothetical protein